MPVCVQRADELRAAVLRATELADIIELRLDCLVDDAQLAAAQRELAMLLAETSRPCIITLRAPEQGGRRALDTQTRVRFWQKCRTDWQRGATRPAFVDIELELVEAHRAEVWPAHRDDASTPALICSHHDFDGVPADLSSLYERMTRTPARVFKLAVQAHDMTDCVPLFQLLARARREGHELIAVAMGAAGVASRVLAPAHGALLTYGSLDDEHATAPGQINAAELRTLYRANALDEATEVFGLVGSPVLHSLSPHIHNAAFAALERNAVYLPFEVRDVDNFVRRIVRPRTRELGWRVRGLSVTAPHKQTIMPHLDHVDEAAREIGAVNTILIAGDELRGYNTDARAALAPLAGVMKLDGARVGLIGAGGAARAVLWSLQRAGANVTLFARDTTKAQPLAAKFGSTLSALADARFASYELIINATPLGTHGANETETPATAEQLRGVGGVYDLVYNPAETRFMQAARTAGCQLILGGLPMLVAQAAAQFELWTGKSAPLDVMRAAAERKLSKARR